MGPEWMTWCGLFLSVKKVKMKESCFIRWQIFLCQQEVNKKFAQRKTTQTIWSLTLEDIYLKNVVLSKNLKALPRRIEDEIDGKSPSTILLFILCKNSSTRLLVIKEGNTTHQGTKMMNARERMRRSIKLQRIWKQKEYIFILCCKIFVF